jgi:hypothetical protein
MQIVGLPPKFWVVTQPPANSPLGDYCFETDYRGFALQVRGGLDVGSIKGIFAEQKDAEAFAGTLSDKGNSDPDVRLHQSPFNNWYASHESLRGVVLHDKDSDQQIEVSPPSHWGRNWAWNLNEDALGIVMTRTSPKTGSTTASIRDGEGQHIFYVGTLSRYVIVRAFNAASALKAGELHPVLDGSAVLTVRIARPEEIELTNWHEQKLAEERRVSVS